MFKTKLIVLIYCVLLVSILSLRCNIKPASIFQSSSTKASIRKMVPSTSTKEKELTISEVVIKKATEFKDSVMEVLQISLENAKKGEPGSKIAFENF